MPVRKLVRSARGVIDVTFNALGVRQRESTLATDAKRWWENPPPQKQAIYSHWRDAFGDAGFNAIGQHTFDVYQMLARGVGFERPARRVIEWGCGGGANALHLAREAETFFGVDVAQASLDECVRQFNREGLSNLRPVLADVAEPERVKAVITEPCDLFVCVHVFEVFPSPAYGQRIVKLAADLIRPGGMALLQIKYPTSLTTQSRRWGYRFGVASMTSYRVSEFWQLAADSGFTPKLVHLEPWLELLHDGRYAYFALTRK